MTVRPLEIRQSYFFTKTPHALFRALSDPRQIERWFVAQAVMPRTAGHPYRLEWPGGYSHEGRVLERVADRRLTLTWPHRSRTAHFTSRVTFSLRRAGAGTFLTVRHTGFPRTAYGLEQYGGTQSGWAYYLLNLRSVLEHGTDLRSPRDA